MISATNGLAMSLSAQASFTVVNFGRRLLDLT